MQMGYNIETFTLLLYIICTLFYAHRLNLPNIAIFNGNVYIGYTSVKLTLIEIFLISIYSNSL